MRHAFETLKFHRVEYKTDARNARSRAAILKLGATQEGIFRKHMIMADGHVRDSVYLLDRRHRLAGGEGGLEKRWAAPMRMSRYLASRAVQTVVTLALMSFVVYLLIGLMPGDPDRHDDRGRSQDDQRGRRPPARRLRPRQAADRALPRLGRAGAAGQFRLLALLQPAGAGRAVAAAAQHAAAGRHRLRAGRRHRPAARHLGRRTGRAAAPTI